MKKIISFMLLLIFAIQPFYVNASTIDGSEVFQINELEYFNMLRSTSDEELLKNGLTLEQIEYIRNFDLVEAVKARAELPDSQLKSMGYSANDISKVKEVTRNDNLTDDQIVNSLSFATITFTLNNPTTSTSSFSFYFSFVWSMCPLFIQDDLIAAIWAGTGFNGSPINVAINKTRSYLSTRSSTTWGPQDNYSWRINDEYRAANLKFKMGYKPLEAGDGLSHWTKYGNGRLVLDAVVSGTIYEMYIKIGYGHSVVTGTPTVSFSGSGPSIGLKFGYSTIEEKTYSRRYRHNGVQVSW